MSPSEIVIEKLLSIPENHYFTACLDYQGNTISRWLCVESISIDVIETDAQNEDGVNKWRIIVKYKENGIKYSIDWTKSTWKEVIEAAIAVIRKVDNPPKYFNIMNEDLKTSKEWQELYPEFIVKNPDGWNRKDFDYSWNIELISKGEYERRRALSTITTKR